MKLLVIDTSYNFEAIKKKKLYQAIFSRDLNGYFSKVWSVHPFADINKKIIKGFGNIKIYKLNHAHFFIEGSFGKFSILKILNFFNFFICQLKIFFFLRKLIINEKINFIKANDPHYNSLLAYLLSKLTKVPFLVRVSGNFEKIYKDTRKPIMKKFFIFRFIEKNFEKFIFKKANYVIAPNKDNLSYAFRYGLLKKKGSVVRYGALIYKKHLIKPSVRKKNFSFKKEINMLDSNFYLIYVGRLEKVKRVNDLIPIIKKIDDVKVKLFIVGNGSLKNFLKKKINQEKLNNRIFLLGEKDQDWLSRFLPNCSCFVATHTGRALAEAAFAGLPVVGYDIDWHSEIIENGKNGFLVKENDFNNFAFLIQKLIYNKKLSTSFSNQIRNKAEKLLSPININKIEINCFKKIKRK